MTTPTYSSFDPRACAVCGRVTMHTVEVWTVPGETGHMQTATCGLCGTITAPMPESPWPELRDGMQGGR